MKKGHVEELQEIGGIWKKRYELNILFLAELDKMVRHVWPSKKMIIGN